MASAGDVLVVGGGVIGCAVALRLRDRGLGVTVVDRAPPGQEASWAAGGILAPHAEAHGPGPAFDLLRESRRAWPAFAAELRARAGVDVGYRDDGTLVVARDEAEAAALERRAAWLREAGVVVERLGARELGALEPALAPAPLALRFGDDHQVDNRLVVRALTAACARAGVVFARAEVRRLRHDGGRVLGVTTDAGPRDAAHVVVAAGAWSALLDGALLPAGAVTPVRGQMIALAAPAPPVRHVVFGAGGYLVPRADGRVLCGSTEERVGFVKEVTADGLGTLCVRAARLCPALGALPLVASWAGLRPASADALPYVGPTAVAGLHLATGHFRNGILWTPLTAAIVAAAVTGDAPPVDAGALSPARL